MRRLISVRDVEAALAAGEDLVIDASTIVTALARDVARERGVTIRTGAPAACAEPAQPCARRRPDVAGAAAPPPCEREPALSACEMERVIRAAIDCGAWSEGDLVHMAEALRGGRHE